MLGFSPFSDQSLPGMRDRYFAPTVLAPFADDMARRMSRLVQSPLLEILADTGVLTQAIASAISAATAIIATDPDPEMVLHARGKPGMSRVTWHRACPESLSYKDGTFGIVACLFGITGVPNLARAYREARRMLKFAGRFVFCMPAALRHNPVAECVQETLEGLFPDSPPRYLRDTLYGHGNVDVVDENLTDAGFTDAIYTTLDLPYHADSAEDAARGYCLGTLTRLEIEQRAPEERERVLNSVTEALTRRFGDGPVTARMRGYFISAAG